MRFKHLHKTVVFNIIFLAILGFSYLNCSGPSAIKLNGLNSVNNSLNDNITSTFTSGFNEPSTSIGNTLRSGSSLQVGQKLTSSNLELELRLQEDGNLVLYRKDGAVEWHSNTMGERIGSLDMQSDGNLVLYNNHRSPLYHSGTNGNPGASLVLTNEGKLVLKLGAQELVTLNTNKPSIAEEDKQEEEEIIISRRVELRTGESLRPGEFIESENGECRLVFQEDGNIVAYKGPQPVYDTLTKSTSPSMLVFQHDGNIVAYESAPALKPYWASNTHDGVSVTLSNTCRLEMKNAKRYLVWHYPLNF